MYEIYFICWVFQINVYFIYIQLVELSGFIYYSLLYRRIPILTKLNQKIMYQVSGESLVIGVSQRSTPQELQCEVI